MSEALPKKTVDQLARMSDALAAIERQLHRLGKQGLQHAGASSADALMALKQTAHNAGLASLAREIEALSQQMLRYVRRDPLFEMTTYRATLNRIWLLSRKTQRLRQHNVLPDQMLDVIGQARRSFELVEDPICFQTLGAATWVTDSGFVGITLYCHVDSQPLLQVVTARPTMYFGHDPRRLRDMPPNDALNHTLGSLSHGAWQVQSAKLSSDRRLSLHKDCRIGPAPYIGRRAYAQYEVGQWAEIVERLHEAAVHPIRGEASVMVCLTPARWGRLESDAKRALATAVLWDATGAELQIRVPLSAANNWTLDSLEMMLNGRQVARRKLLARPDALFGRVWVEDGGLCLMPFTGLYHRAVTLAGRQAGRVHEVHLGID